MGGGFCLKLFGHCGSTRARAPLRVGGSIGCPLRSKTNSNGCCCGTGCVLIHAAEDIPPATRFFSVLCLIPPLARERGREGVGILDFNTTHTYLLALPICFSPYRLLGMKHSWIHPPQSYFWSPPRLSAAQPGLMGFPVILCFSLGLFSSVFVL